MNGKKVNAKVQEIAQAKEQLPAKEDWLVDRVAALTLETDVKTKEYLEGLSLLAGKLDPEGRSASKALLTRPALKDTPHSNPFGNLVAEMAGYDRMPKPGVVHEQPRHLYNGVSKEIRAAIIISEPLPITDDTQEGLERSIALADQRRTINFKPAANVSGYETPERTFCLCTNCYITLSFEIKEINPASCTECKEVEFDSTKDFSHLAESFQPTEAQQILKEIKAEDRRDKFEENFFFCPVDSSGLEKLTEDQRIDLLQNQGNYDAGLQKADPMLRGDLLSACENACIPTHRIPNAMIPEYGDVPFDLRSIWNKGTK